MINCQVMGEEKMKIGSWRIVVKLWVRNRIHRKRKWVGVPCIFLAWTVTKVINKKLKPNSLINVISHIWLWWRILFENLKIYMIFLFPSATQYEILNSYRSIYLSITYTSSRILFLCVNSIYIYVLYVSIINKINYS